MDKQFWFLKSFLQSLAFIGLSFLLILCGGVISPVSADGPTIQCNCILPVPPHGCHYDGPLYPTGCCHMLECANPGHPQSSSVTAFTGTSVVIPDVGGWAYDGTSGDTSVGQVAVACTHNDLKGNLWDQN